MKNQPRQTGFTLVELLTVIVIISLLLTIIVPTISAIARGAYARKTAARIATLETGISAFYEDAGRRFYPGQQDLKKLVGGDETGATQGPDIWTGSQWLARSLFTKKTGVFPADFGAKSDPSYATFATDMLVKDDPANYSDPAADTANMAISDHFPDALAICYYVSRPRRQGLNQYMTGADNIAYTDAAPNPANNTTTNFEGFITNPNFSTAGNPIPFHDGEYLLIAPGIDRKYFTTDDITNWNR